MTGESLQDRVAVVTGASSGIGARGGTIDNDTMYGTAGLDLMEGFGGDDRMYGLGSGDFMYGYAGKDRMDGGDGDDIALVEEIDRVRNC